MKREDEVVAQGVGSLRRASVAAAGLEVAKTENPYAFDGERGFALGQGQ